MTTEADLDTHLLQGPDLDTDEARQAWRCDDDEAAGWALRKLDAAQREHGRIAHEADREIARIEAWKDREQAIVQRDIDYFKGQLIGYRRRREADDATLPPTYKLPWGNLTHRKGRPSTKIVNKDEFVSWALDNVPEALNYEPKVSALADFPRKDLDGRTVIVGGGGEIIPGVEVRFGDDVYDAQPITAEPF